ncbi:hypothetical protein C5748_00980 [Phyllobacterium phragmitis]|uniref:Glycosyl transferase family 1 domain-containing protein n=1 Tax=Phyllobacterium phragmitis TaxID=2670329 RepID=A0A2S9IZ00_9HYPH|nr:glycosyltransferase [Phyllobacterium phragmitis]PRD45761.1 hypothetical protein C5748_00980 [Phyllobacterium phragmitis]
MSGKRTSFDKQYRAFEDRFRGSRESVRHRLSVYLPLLETLERSHPNARKALDLGSGRGEWLGLIMEKGWEGIGVDPSAGMANSALEAGIQTVAEDALTFLKKQDDQSFGLVTAFHIVEHLETVYLLDVINEIQRVLIPGGVLIIETPNPENLTVGTWSFYMDPTHVKPIPPLLLQFHVQTSGIENAHVIRLNHDASVDNMRPLETVIYTLFNVGMDYALLGQKNLEVENISSGGLERFVALNAQHSPADLEYLIGQIRLFESEIDDIVQLRVGEKAHLAVRETNDRLDALSNELNHTKRILESIYNSKSWKISKVLQNIYRSIPFVDNVNGLSHALINRSHSVFGNFSPARRLASAILTPFPRLKFRIINSIHKTNGGPLDIYTNKRGGFHYKSYGHEDYKVLNRNFSETDVTILGHFSGSYSLSYINRCLALALAEISGMNVRIIPHHGKPENSIIAPSDSSTKRLKTLMEANDRQRVEKISIIHHYPVLDRDVTAGNQFILFFWEESFIPNDIMSKLEKYDIIIAPSRFVRKVLEDNGCRTPVIVLPVPLGEVYPSDVKVPKEKCKKITLLHVSSCFPRKGVDVLLCGFNELARDDEDIQLVIKTFYNIHNDIFSVIDRYVDKDIRSRINVVFDEYSTDEMKELYDSCDAVVLPSRGEGLNLPAIEAGIRKIPVIATSYGGQLDFLNDANSWLIPYSYGEAQSHFSSAYSYWAQPDLESFVAIVREVVGSIRRDGEDLNRKADALFDTINRTYLSGDSAVRFISSLDAASGYEKELSEGGVTFVSTWAEACGISEYTAKLARELRGQHININILSPTYEVGDDVNSNYKKVNGFDVLKGWKKNVAMRPFSSSHMKFMKEIVWFQHHFSWYELDDAFLRNIELIKSSGRIVIITLHTTDVVARFRGERIESLVRSLELFDRIIVHNINDLNNLGFAGVTDNVTLIQQGVSESYIDKVSEEFSYIIGSFGFLLPHKNVLAIIDAFSEFIDNTGDGDKYRLRLMNAVRGDEISRMEYKECLRSIEKKNIGRQVEFITEFLSEEEVKSSLSECDIVILPYLENMESSSAAVRTSLEACPFVATSPARLFEEVRDITIPLGSFAADAVKRVLFDFYVNRDEAHLRDVSHRRRQWISDNSWRAIAKRVGGLITALRHKRALSDHLRTNENRHRRS